jgi:hypothetical protein
VNSGLVLSDEQAWVNYNDATAPGAGPGNQGVSKAEILGAVAGQAMDFNKDTILKPGAPTVTAQIYSRLSGQVIAQGSMPLQLQAAGNTRWRGSAVLNGTRVELNVDWDGSGKTGKYHVWLYPAPGSGPLRMASAVNLLEFQVILGTGSGETPAGGASTIGGPEKPWTQENESSRVRSK